MENTDSKIISVKEIVWSESSEEAKKNPGRDLFLERKQETKRQERVDDGKKA